MFVPCELASPAQSRKNRRESLLRLRRARLDFVPATVASIGEHAFSFCDSLTALDVSPENPNFRSVDGVLFDAALTTLLRYPIGRVVADYAVPSSVVNIGPSAFSAVKSLTSISLPDGLRDVGVLAFSGCANLATLALPKRLETLGFASFSGCESLHSIALPETLEILRGSTFYGCSSLAAISLPSTLRKIESNAFENCAALTTVALPDGVETIGKRAFSGCASLTQLVFPSSVKSIARKAFFGCRALRTSTFTGETPTVDAAAFAECHGLHVVAFKEVSPLAREVASEAFPSCDVLPLDKFQTQTLDGVLFSADGKTLLACLEPKTEYVVPDGVATIAAKAFTTPGRYVRSRFRIVFKPSATPRFSVATPWSRSNSRAA